MSPKNLNKDTNFIMKGNGSWWWEGEGGLGKDTRRLCRVTTLLGGGIVLLAAGKGLLGSVFVLHGWCAALGLPSFACSVYQISFNNSWGFASESPLPKTHSIV